MTLFPRALAALGAIGAACGAHEDVTPVIPVQPGAAARAMALFPGHFAAPVSARQAAADAGPEPPPRAKGFLVFTCLEPRGAGKGLGRVGCAIRIAGTSDSAEPATELVSETGKVNVALSPGAYQVTVSRGLEYDRASWAAEVVAGEAIWAPNEGAVVLHRVVDTRGYYAADVRLAASAPEGEGDTFDAVFDDAAGGVEIAMGDESFAASARRATETSKIEDALAVVDLGAAAGALDALDAIDPFTDRGPFFSRVLAKRPVTAIASAPARTYVRVDDDGPLTSWSPAREADFVRGVHERRDVVLTTGPFVRATANGAPIGGVARAGAEKSVEVKVHVECAPWMSVDTLSVVRASDGSLESQKVKLAPSPSGARSAEAVFKLRVSGDDAIVVLAESSSVDPPDASRDASAPATPPPRAMTGAIWVDADGDGESLGRMEEKRK